MMKNNHGFTLIELVVTLAVFGIVVATAAPSLSSFLGSNQRSAQVNTLISALNLARSEAVKRNTNVSLCTRNSAGTACNVSNNWDSGWIVFVDTNADAAINASDTILRVQEQLFKRAAPQDVTLVETIADSRSITYQARGDTNLVASFRRCDDDGAAAARAVMVALTGRVRMSKDGADAGSIHEDNAGNLTCP